MVPFGARDVEEAGQGLEHDLDALSHEYARLKTDVEIEVLPRARVHALFPTDLVDLPRARAQTRTHTRTCEHAAGS